MKSSTNILKHVFFLKKNTKMKDKTIDIFIQRNLKYYQIRSNMNSPKPFTTTLLVSRILITSNSVHSASKFARNNNINAELKPHNKDHITAMNLQDIIFSSWIGISWHQRSQVQSCICFWEKKTMKYSTLKSWPTSLFCNTFSYFYIKHVFDGKYHADLEDVGTWKSYWLHNFN